MIAMGGLCIEGAPGRQCSSARSVSVLRRARPSSLRQSSACASVARMLLRTSFAMHEDPGQVIKSLRLALDMSQADFARAAGWAVSTISSWERGRSRPSRLAFKTILAFAEERGVQYRPATGRVLLPAPPRDDSDVIVTDEPTSAHGWERGA